MPALQTNSRLGTYETAQFGDETVRAFVPPPLPPDPPLDLPPLLGKIESANRELGRLDGIASILPSTELFLLMYVAKEALLSSQIEGTQSSLADLLVYQSKEQPDVPLDDVREVSNYVDALYFGLERLKEFPLSLRLVREMHSKLLASGRGAAKQPGEFRTSQNWIGGTRPGNALFVPPPPDKLMDCMGALESFWHDRKAFPPLIRAGLAHVQFETIHPFLDGNGRLGRLLITLMLCEEQALHRPILYLSLYLKRHRQHYYDLLQRVREQGEWEQWLDFFLEGVAETSKQGYETAQRLLQLFKVDEAKINGLGRPASTALRIHNELKRSPVISVPILAERLKITQATLNKSLAHLVQLGIVDELTGRARGRLFRYSLYMAILQEGTEPLPP